MNEQLRELVRYARAARGASAVLDANDSTVCVGRREMQALSLAISSAEEALRRDGNRYQLFGLYADTRQTFSDTVTAGSPQEALDLLFKREDMEEMWTCLDIIAITCGGQLVLDAAQFDVWVRSQSTD